jgi:hypothetical protein
MATKQFFCKYPKQFFLIYLILPAALSPGVYSVANKNEYQKQKKYVSGGVKRGR